jgi:hypothetical protein
VNTKLEVFAELFIELLEILSIFRDLSEKFNTLLSDVLFDDLEDLVVLKILSGNVKGEIF